MISSQTPLCHPWKSHTPLWYILSCLLPFTTIRYHYLCFNLV